MSSGRPRRRADAAAVEHAASSRPATSCGRDRADRRCGPAGVSTSTIGSSQNRPREPVRTISTSSPRCAAPRERGRHLVGTDARARRHRAGRRCAASSRASASSASSRASSSRADGSPSSIADGAERAQAEAVDRLERDAPSAWCRPIDAEALAARRGERIAAQRLAGFGAAELQHMPAGRLAAEVVIEGDDAVHLGARRG